MADMDPELIKKELIGAFELIRELDSRPDIMEKLPKNSIIIDRGKKRMFVSTKKNANVFLL